MTLINIPCLPLSTIFIGLIYTTYNLKPFDGKKVLSAVDEQLSAVVIFITYNLKLTT